MATKSDPIKVFLCASGRTGSQLLSRAMTYSGIGKPLEYFNPGRIGQIIEDQNLVGIKNSDQLRTDASARQTYINAILRTQSVNDVFASVIHWGQFASFLNNPEGEQFLTGGYFVRLYRHDLLAQAISRHIAWETGRWGLTDKVSTVPVNEPRFFDAEQIEAHLKLLAEEEVNWRVYLARNDISPLTLQYEQFSADMPRTLQKIVDAFDLKLETARFDYLDPGLSEVRDKQVPPREDIRSRFLSSRQRVSSAK